MSAPRDSKPAVTEVVRPVLSLAAMLAAAGFMLAPATPAHADDFVLVGGTVHPASGPAIPNGTVVVRNGRIESVGTGAAPAGLPAIDCKGKHVYPGLVSANTDIGLVEIESVRGTVDNAETGNINPNVRAEIEVNPESEHIPVARINGVTSALIIPRGGAIAGTSAIMHLDGWTFEDMTIKAPVALHVNWPNMSIVHNFFVTASDEEQKKSREDAIAAIRKAFDDARAYDQAVAAEREPAIPRHDRDVKWDAMVKAVRGEIPVYFHASALNQIRAVLRFCDEEKLTNVGIVGGNDSWRIAEELKVRKIPVLCDATLEVPRHRWDPYDAAYTLPAKLAKAGVQYCITDGGGSWNARNLPYNASMAAAFGLDRDEALRAVTLYPAQILGVADRVGSIEPGKVADLVVADGDLLEDATHVEQVWINGHQISMETKQTRLFHKYDQRPRGALARAHAGDGATGNSTR